jgi:hypothetical protein
VGGDLSIARQARAGDHAPAMVQTDIARGYYTTDEAVRLFTRPAAAE